MRLSLHFMMRLLCQIRFRAHLLLLVVVLQHVSDTHLSIHCGFAQRSRSGLLFSSRNFAPTARKECGQPNKFGQRIGRI